MVFEKIGGGNVRVKLLPTVARHGASPVIDVTMESAAQVYGERAIGVLLSGMGSDGAMGLGMIKDVGGETIAQNEETCLVFGMPKAAIERKLVNEVLPLEKIAEAIVAHF
jgi:two-component system chemotaxis response regulator CheB